MIGFIFRMACGVTPYTVSYVCGLSLECFLFISFESAVDPMPLYL